MKALKIIAIILLVYIAIVAVFESLLGYFQPEAQDTVVITTFDADGAGHERVLSGLDMGEQFYVAVNHWPRAWYRRALQNPEVKLARQGQTLDYRAVQVSGDEHDRVAAEHPIPIGVRALMGFAPRHFLRLDPVAGPPAVAAPPAVADQAALEPAAAAPDSSEAPAAEPDLAIPATEEPGTAPPAPQ